MTPMLLTRDLFQKNFIFNFVHMFVKREHCTTVLYYIDDMADCRTEKKL